MAGSLPTMGDAPSMHLELRLELPADARLLAVARRAMTKYLTDAGATEDDRDDVVLALDEACANVVRHAFPHNPDGRMRLLAEITDGQVRVQVEDDGVGFDPDSPRRKPDEWDASGRGLFIIRELMTSVDLESPTATGGTRVVMQKARTPGFGAIAAAFL